MLGIKKLDIYIAKKFGLLFVGTFFICQFVLMMQFLWQHIDKLIGKGLSLEIMAQFFWHMSLFLVPQALPLAILLSSLITFGNLGESMELTAIKAAGISLMRTFRSLIVISCLVAASSFYFQDQIGPYSNQQLAQLLVSMKQKSPEIGIPEGVFYDGIPQCNLYVQKKNTENGMLYGIMIYRMTNSFEDAAIILADSGMLQATAEKKHLVLTLYSGKWFENMRSQELAGSASVPYRQETFWKKKIVLDFDGDFSLTDGNSLANNAKGKSLKEIIQALDSMQHHYDSIGHVFYQEGRNIFYAVPESNRDDSTRAVQLVAEKKLLADSLYDNASAEVRQAAVNNALSRVQQELTDLEFRKIMTSDGDKIIRQHKIEAINKFTLAFSCIVFFFIGAPLGAIIRKGGFGLPIIISVLVFIIFYILDNTGYRMSRNGIWTIWFGKGLATAILGPLAVFITYKANADWALADMDGFKKIISRLGKVLHRLNLT